MTRRLHLRGRPNHPEDDPRPHENTYAYQFANPRVISGSWIPRRSGGIEDARFLHQQANWCYQLAWQCFDLAVALELNLMGNKLTPKGLDFGRRNGRHVTQKLVDPRTDDKVATDKA